jgi:molybdopterin-guanine dinucleotide biosynthesis protein A
MGEPKHLLKLPDGKTLLQHCFALLQKFCPLHEKVHISAAQETQLGQFMSDNHDNVELVLDADSNYTDISAGPAAGLIAAFHSRTDTTWLVVACDYPLLTSQALELLCNAYNPPATCYKNGDGFEEPLLAIWSPAALQSLVQAAADKRKGPSAVIRGLCSKTISPPEGYEEWLFNVNTREDWEKAQRALKDRE